MDCQIKSKNGQIHFSMKGVEAPEQWSQLAIDITASKYFRKSGVPGEHEKSIRQLVGRVVQSIAKSGRAQKYFKSTQEAEAFRNELTFILLSQRAFFNSPVWFNCGLYEAYKIQGDTPNWAWDFKSRKVEPQQHSYLRPQVSACFIQSVEDSLESIFDLAKNEARLFKYGSGSGTNFSNLRSKYEKLEGGGTSSGLISFLDVLDRGAGAVKSGGVTRRAAKMVCLDIDHPELIEFIQWKALEEKKARVLIEAGYDSDFEGEAYRSVSGQNANTSVRVSDAFIKALKTHRDWALKARTSGKTLAQIPAGDIWNEISKAAYECADPGLQFSDTINSWHTCPKDGEIRASNPCSEYMFIDDSACNLASLNLLAFLDVDGGFDLESYLHTVQVMFLAQDILVDLAGYPTAKIAQNSHQFRPLGLGYCGLGAFLMRKAVPYDSEEGRNWAAILTALLSGQAYLTSAEVAAEKGPFASFMKNKSNVIKIIKRHQDGLKKIKSDHIPHSYFQIAKELWVRTLLLANKKGIRNSQVSVMAPTGTIGLVMDSDTTGIEPEFSLVKFKKISGGGELRLVSSSISPALEKLGYDSGEIQEILDYVEVHSCLEGAPHLQEEHLPIFDGANKNGNLGERFLSSESHLQMMAVIQPFLSGAISKTINLPEGTSESEISEIFLRAWELGLKSIAVYRDRSKQAQPLDRQPSRLIAGASFANPPCPDCGATTKLVGGCFCCLNCGTTVGCA